MNRKEIFEKVKTHLLTQGRKALNGRDCAYRAPNGDKCAVGCLITDECYDPAIENMKVGHSLVQKALECSGIKLDVDEWGIVDLLTRLQAIHDHNPVEDWPRLLDEVAREEKLA